jgi:predicted metal-dependent hydrolase
VNALTVRRLQVDLDPPFARHWAGAWRLLLGADGVLRHGLGPWRRYLRAGFHPAQGDGAPAQAWLAGHAALAPPVNPGLTSTASPP